MRQYDIGGRHRISQRERTAPKLRDERIGQPSADTGDADRVGEEKCGKDQPDRLLGKTGKGDFRRQRPGEDQDGHGDDHRNTHGNGLEDEREDRGQKYREEMPLNRVKRREWNESHCERRRQHYAPAPQSGLAMTQIGSDGMHGFLQGTASLHQLPKPGMLNYSSPMAEKLGLRESKKKQTRRLILKAADELFRKKGFGAATLEEIAAKAGVHKLTVLRYFGSKDEIALAFRQVGLHNFKKGLLDPARSMSVLEYWRDFIGASASEVAKRGDVVRYTKLVESEPALMAASLSIQMQYEDLLASELSREAGQDPQCDLYARLLAAFLVGGNFTVIRMMMNNGTLDRYRSTALSVVDFAVRKFPSRSAIANWTS
jgi:AcrR family transcriptional regulator